MLRIGWRVEGKLIAGGASLVSTPGEKLANEDLDFQFGSAFLGSSGDFWAFGSSC